MRARRQNAKSAKRDGLLALIIARGGSQRIPKKNIREFFGHPMLAYAVAAARNSGIFQRVVVSTDSAEIGSVAEWYGAEYLPRPAELAKDSVGAKDVALHALETLARRDQFYPGALCQLMPNCPLRRSSDISAHYELFQQERRNFQISVVNFRGVYPQWSLAKNANGEGCWLFGEHMVNSQKLQRVYCPTGAIWWTQTRSFVEQKTFYGSPFHIAEMDANRGLDLDTLEDLDLAELLVRGLTQRDSKSPLEPVTRTKIILGKVRAHGPR